MAKLSVHLVCWNGEKYIKYLFDSLRKQTFKDWSLFVLDNCSKDNTINSIEKELNNFPVQYKFFKNLDNTGFAGGHNQLFKEANSEYILLLNQDMYIQSDCFEKMVGFADTNESVSAISSRLMKWNYNKIGNDGLEKSFSDDVDALGLKVFRSRRVIEQFTGQSWKKIQSNFKSKAMHVFGVSGAFPLFRKKILKSVAFENGNIFDESYDSYKEDVDLAFRLRSAGQDSIILLDAVAYHDRSAACPTRMTNISAIKNKRAQSFWVIKNSYKNHIMTLYKNEYWQNLTLDFPWILWYELRKFLYFLIFDVKVLKGLLEIWKNHEALKSKKIQIKNNRKVDYRKIRIWWSV